MGRRAPAELHGTSMQLLQRGWDSPLLLEGVPGSVGLGLNGHAGQVVLEAGRQPRLAGPEHHDDQEVGDGSDDLRAGGGADVGSLWVRRCRTGGAACCVPTSTEHAYGVVFILSVSANLSVPPGNAGLQHAWGQHNLQCRPQLPPRPDQRGMMNVHRR